MYGVVALVILVIFLIACFFCSISEPFHSNADDAVAIDVVYTWVDGSDPVWRQKKSAYVDTSDLLERYHSLDELKYSLKSLYKYAPWINHIYIVVDDDQAPQFVNWSDSKITLIKHSEIIPAENLPLFNSVAIETALHHIPGLSEHFLYFNDDVFFGQDVQPQDVLDVCLCDDTDHVAKADLTQPQYEWLSNQRNGHRLLEQRYGGGVELVVPSHVHHFCRKSLMYEIETMFPEQYAHTQQKKVRQSGKMDPVCDDCICLPKMQCILGVYKGMYAKKKEVYGYYDLAKETDVSRLEELRQKRPRFFCLNNSFKSEDAITNLLEDLYDFACPYIL